MLKLPNLLSQYFVFLLEALQPVGELGVLQLLHDLHVVLIVQVLDLAFLGRIWSLCFCPHISVLHQSVGHEDTVGWVLLGFPEFWIMLLKSKVYTSPTIESYDLKEDISAGVDDWLAEAGVLVLHEVHSEAVLEHQGEVLLVNLAGPGAGRGVAREAGQHHQPVIVAAHRAVLTLALQPRAAGAELLLTTNLQQGWGGSKARRTGKGAFTLQQDLRRPRAPDHTLEIPSFFHVRGSILSSRR